MESNFTDKEWHGEFFLPGQHEKKFMGTVTFSPVNGLVLTYQITNDEQIYNTDILYGILKDGDHSTLQCTLIGRFTFNPDDIIDPYNSISTISFGPNIVAYHGKANFHFLVIGSFLNKDDTFTKISFTLTGMQEFFFPHGYIDLIKYSKQPLFNAKTDYGEIMAGNNATFTGIREDITTQIYNKNDKALAELKIAFEKINKKYTDSSFMFKKELSYLLSITTDQPTKIAGLYRHILDISNLFAILIFRPVYPDTIKLRQTSDSGHPIVSTVYPSMHMEQRTFDLCKSKSSHHKMPITALKINTAEVIKKWLMQKHNYTTIVSGLQNETKLKNKYSLYAEIVMHAAQFEGITQLDGAEHGIRYEYPVTQYGTDKMRNILTKIFLNANQNDIGVGISDFRNEIAHMKPPNILNALSINDKICISKLLQLTILGYTLNKIGVNKNVIEDYQNRFTPNLVDN